MEGPDDVNLSLLSRPSVVRTTVPNGSFEQTNFLAALDLPLSTGDADPEVVAAMARYLGVAEVVVRNDQRWETFGGTRPSVVAERLDGGRSLDPVAAYGRPGEHTVAPVSDFYPPDQALEDAAVPPLRRYAVAEARPIVRTEAAGGAMLVDGDSFAIPSLVRLGLAQSEPAFRLLGSATPAELAAAVADGARVVVTDSNRRRAWGSFRTGQNYSPTLGAGQPLPASTLSLFGDPGTQTVTRLEGGLGDRHRVGVAADRDRSASRSSPSTATGGRPGRPATSAARSVSRSPSGWSSRPRSGRSPCARSCPSRASRSPGCGSGSTPARSRSRCRPSPRSGSTSPTPPPPR